MSVLITGGTGFIGTEVARLLLERGEKKPVVLDINPSPQRLGDIANRVEVVRGDLGNFSDILNAVKATRPEVIYHLGSMFSVPSEADPPASLRANVLGTSTWADSTSGNTASTSAESGTRPSSAPG